MCLFTYLFAHIYITCCSLISQPVVYFTKKETNIVSQRYNFPTLKCFFFSYAGFLKGSVANLPASELKVDERVLVAWVVWWWWWWWSGEMPSIPHHSRWGVQMAKGTRTRRGWRRKDGCSAARQSRIIYQYVNFVWPVIPATLPSRVASERVI